ncbi:MAG: carbonic anhydrase [Dehalococcoidia bacterium]
MEEPSNLLIRSTCAALVITCSDFRFKSAEHAFIEACGLTDDYDLIARPGAARSLVAPRSAAAGQTMHEEIRLLWTLHSFTRILLVNHVSCRAYDDIATAANEYEIHEQHLLAAAATLARAYPDVTPETYLADTAPEGIEVRRVHST